MTYRLKNPNVEAYQVAPTNDLTGRLPPGWLVEAILNRGILPETGGRLHLLHSDAIVEVGDWIIQDPDGSINTLPDSVFNRLYERCPEATKN